MELIVISESKLKIMLSAPDMAHYKLHNLRKNRTDTHTREAFRKIFDDARTEIGFDTHGERLFIQLYTSLEGGCEIFVTKLGNHAFPCKPAHGEQGLHACENITHSPNFENEQKLLDNIYSQNDEEEDMSDQALPQVCTPTYYTKAYVFDATQHLLITCHRLLREGYRDRSSAYVGEDGKTWYLFLNIPDTLFFDPPVQFMFLHEFAHPFDIEIASLYLSEYGKCICDGNAVDILGHL